MVDEWDSPNQAPPAAISYRNVPHLSGRHRQKAGRVAPDEPRMAHGRQRNTLQPSRSERWPQRGTRNHKDRRFRFRAFLCLFVVQPPPEARSTQVTPSKNPGITH